MIPPDDLDPTDESILDEIRKMLSVLDPVPDTLVERVQFALDLETADAEVLRLSEQVGLRAGVRGGEESRTITFEGDDLTIMISVSVQTQRLVRLDGWLAPPGDHVVELRTSEGPLLVRADDQGRFVMDEVIRGLAQLVVRPAVDVPGVGAILAVTPSIVL
ncbi:hypothetical protein ACQP2T_22625 [Nonomuraea sp. CA-143628]|uniref:hypothetical protein n=1 Tax=Nonomuraea sp. CA-143628 TaxID=3239997 RepID=UPI003D89EA66